MLAGPLQSCSLCGACTLCTMDVLEFPVDNWYFPPAYIRATSIALSGCVNPGALFRLRCRHSDKAESWVFIWTVS